MNKLAIFKMESNAVKETYVEEQLQENATIVPENSRKMQWYDHSRN